MAMVRPSSELRIGMGPLSPHGAIVQAPPGGLSSRKSGANASNDNNPDGPNIMIHHIDNGINFNCRPLCME